MIMPPDTGPNAPTMMYQGLPGDGLDDFIRKFCNSAKTDPFGSWLLLPTERLVDHVLDQLTIAGVPVISSRVCTISDFCHNYFEEHRTTSRFLSPGESGLLLLDILTKNKEKLPIFFTRNRPSSGTINDLRKFIEVIIMRKIVFPECLLDLESQKSDQIDFIYSSYRDFLRKHDLLDKDTIVEWTIDRLFAESSASFGHVFVYGLFYLEPLEQDLVLAIRMHSSLFSQFIPSGVDSILFKKQEPWIEDVGEPVSIPASSIVSEALSGLFAVDGKIETRGTLKIASFSSRNQEIVSIAGEIKHLRENGVPYSSITVTFPNVRTQIPIIEEVFSDFGIPWNSAQGTLLSRSPLVNFLTSILRLVTERYPREGVVRLLGNPYFRPGAGYEKLNVRELDIVSRLAQVEGEKNGWFNNLKRYLARIDEEIQNDTALREKEMVERVFFVVSRLFEDLQPFEGKKTAREYRKNFLDLMDGWGILDISASHGRDHNREEQASLEAFRKCLDDMGRSPELTPDENVDAWDFHENMSTLMKEIEVPLNSDPTGVKLLGVRQCGHENFPVLFLAGLVEGEMPSLTTRLPFMNTRENTRMGTRTLDEILGEERYYFVSALLAGRERLYLSAPLSEGDKILLTSAFFERAKERTTANPWGQDSSFSPKSSQKAAAEEAGTTIASGSVCDALDLLPESEYVDEVVNRINIER
jgi:ATP-dependent helicase/nuclease subunit B